MLIPRQVIVVATAVAISLLGDSTLYAVLPSHADQLGIKLAYVGVLLSVNRFVRLLTNSLAGYVYDHIGRWWHFVAALVVGGCTTAAYGLFKGLGVFLIARLLWGTSWSFLRLEGYATVIKQATAQNRGKLMGVYGSISGIGFFAGSFLGGILTDTVGFRNCVLSFAALALLCAVAAFLELSRNHPSEEGEIRRQGDSATKETDFHISPSAQNVLRNTQHVSPSPELEAEGQKSRRHWLIYYISCINSLVGSVTASTLGLLIKTRLGAVIQFSHFSIKVASLTGILLALRWLLFFLLAPVFGHLADRLSRRFVQLFGLLIRIVGLGILATGGSFIWIGTALILTSISSPAISVALDASITDATSARQRGKTIGAYTTFTDLGSAGGPFVGYRVIDWIGVSPGLGTVYWAGMVLLLSGVLASFGVKRAKD